MKKRTKQTLIALCGVFVVTGAAIIGCNTVAGNLSDAEQPNERESISTGADLAPEADDKGESDYHYVVEEIAPASADTEEKDSVSISTETDSDGGTTVTIDRQWTQKDTEAGTTGGASPDMGLDEGDVLIGTDDAKQLEEQTTSTSKTDTGSSTPQNSTSQSSTTGNSHRVTHTPDGIEIDDSWRDPNNPPAVSNNPAAKNPPGAADSDTSAGGGAAVPSTAVTDNSNTGTNASGTTPTDGASSGNSTSSGTTNGTAPSGTASTPPTEKGHYTGEISADGNWSWLISKWCPYSPGSDGGTGGDDSKLVTGGLSGNKIGNM